MPAFARQDKYLALALLALAVAVVGGLHLWQGHRGFNLWDEGFLWYGVQRVLLGEVPLRDFMAYDPGRYYWAAALMRAWGDPGLLSLRRAVALFQILGLFAGLWVIARSRPRPGWLYLLVVAGTLAVWMFPRHKLFDISLCLLQLGGLTWLMERPTGRRHFAVGLLVGLTAVFGRNHGLYGLVGSLGVLGYLQLRRTEGPGGGRALALWAAGIGVGFAPILGLVIAVPGFGVAFWENIRFTFEIKATNLPLPVPWPWRVNVAALAPGEALRGGFVGLFFIGTLVFGGLALAWVVALRWRRRPVAPALVAAAFLALPYAHVAFARADVGHLAQGIFPLLIGCFVGLTGQRPRICWSGALLLAAISFSTMLVEHPGWRCAARRQGVPVEISGSRLLVDPDTARNVALLRTLAARYAPQGQSFLATPFWPGAYALLGRRSPLWENFAFFQHAPAFEQAEIRRLQAARPAFVVVLDYPLDGRDDLRFCHTHPLIERYIREHFERVRDASFPFLQIYRAPAPGP